MSSILENTIQSATNTVVTIGKAALHALDPDNFEYYMCSLKLLDSQNNVLGFMTFVVMPNNISESKTQINTITKTNKGIVSLFNSSFVPRDISIQGTFGRKFRLLLGMQEATESSFFSGNMGFDVLGGDVLVKTGYGLTKMLKSMIDGAYKLDQNGKPCVLLFNNYALNTHYMVEPIQSTFTQSVENNMIWYYSLDFKAIAEANTIEQLSDSEKNGELLNAVDVSVLASSISNILPII